MKLVVAAVRPTPILWWRASGLASPTEVPASTLPARGIAPVRARMASRSVVLPLWNGPTSAMHRGPLGLLPPDCPISASVAEVRPLRACRDIVSGETDYDKGMSPVPHRRSIGERTRFP